MVKLGGNITLRDAQAFAVEGGDEKLVATMTGNLMAVFGRVDIAH